MAEKSIFRKAALDRLASPEQLDQLLRFAPPVRDLLVRTAQALRLPERGAPVQRKRTPTVLQMEALECGAASLAMVLGYHGRYVPLEELRVACGVSRDGSKASNIVRAARTYGMLAKGFKKEPDQLADLPLPLIAFVNFDHFVVVEGFAPGRVFLNDPATGPRTISSEEFDQAFTGVVLVITPGPEFQPGGTRPSPVAALRRRLKGFESILLAAVLLSLALFGLLAMLAALLPAQIDGMGGEAALALGAGLAYIVLAWLRAMTLLRFEAQVAERGGHEFMQHALRLPVTFFTQRHSGEIASRALLNAELGRSLAGLIPGGLDTLLAFGLLGLLAWLDPVLALIAAVTAVLCMLSLLFLALREQDGAQQLAQDRGKLYGATYSGIQLIETLQAGGGESDAFARWAGHQARAVSGEQESAAHSHARSTIPWVIGALGLAAILLAGGLRMLDGSLSGGELFAALFLLIAMLQPIGRLLQLVQTARHAVSVAGRLDDLLRHAPDPLLENSLEDTGAKLSGALELRDLTFGYSRVAPPLIEGLNLTLHPGRRVALVGGSGSGKSTVAKLVAGLYEPWDGEILFDGKPRAAWPRAVITRSLAVVDQEIALFAGTVRENITMWDAAADDAAVVRAAHDAAIHDEIMKRAGGYNGMLEGGGRDLSGGQRQRIEIARALLRDPSILILDEATSALDPLAEQLIDERVRNRGCACLIVAHRLSAVRDADEILVLDQGRVVQRGTHDTLIAVPGPYATLFSVDQGTTKAADEPVETLDEQPAEPDVQTRSNSLDELLAACRLIGAALGVPVRRPSVGIGVPREALAAIAEDSGLRTRRVALRGEWWHETGTALLGFRKESHRPVALLPTGTGRYLLVDPQDGSRTPVTAELADGLSSFAEMLYRPLPDDPIEGWRLLRWAVHGGLIDLRLLIGAGAAYGLISLVLPFAGGIIAGSGLVGQVLGLALVFVAVLAGLLRLAGNLAGTGLIGRAAAGLQAAIWDRLLRQPAAFFHGRDPGDLGSQVIGIGQAGGVVAGVLAALAIHGSVAVFNLILLGTIDWRLGLAALGFAAGTILLTGGLSQAALRQGRILGGEDGRLAALALDLTAGVVRIRTAGAETRMLKRWSGAVNRRAAVARRAALLRGALAALGAVVVAALPAYIGLIQLLRPDLGVAARVSGLIAFAQIMLAAGVLSGTFADTLRLLPLYERLRALLRSRPQADSAAADPGALSGALTIEQVNFGYSAAAPVLRDISLTVRTGELLAIVGPSGSGKSTLLRLLLGFERPHTGAVCYDGRNLAELDTRAIRRQVGVVLQHGQVLADDIYHNIVGVAPLSVERAWEAARMAGLDAEIRALPMGMYTLVPEGGSTFSGGQRQRMLIARALVRRPRIVLFDEATSALDNHSQNIVGESLSRLHATRIVIAHRLSTVVDADRIIVIDGGRIVEEGNYTELIARNGLFAGLARRQLT